MDLLISMRAFVRVVQATNFQEAARLEGLAQGTVSKRVAALESHLGVQLLRRNQRTVTLTALGETHYKSCLRILEDVETSESLNRTSTGASSKMIIRHGVYAGLLRYRLQKCVVFA